MEAAVAEERDPATKQLQFEACEGAAIMRYVLDETAPADKADASTASPDDVCGDEKKKLSEPDQRSVRGEASAAKAERLDAGEKSYKDYDLSKVGLTFNEHVDDSRASCPYQLDLEFSSLQLSDTYEPCMYSHANDSLDVRDQSVLGRQYAGAHTYPLKSTRANEESILASSTFNQGHTRSYSHAFPQFQRNKPSRPPAVPLQATPKARRRQSQGGRPFTESGLDPGDIVRFDFPPTVAAIPTGSEKLLSYYGLYAGGGYVLHCFNLSDPASTTVPWVLLDWRVWQENVLWAAHAVVFRHTVTDFFNKGALRVRACNKFDSIHRPLPSSLIVDRGYSRMMIPFPDYLNPGFWTSWSFACWARYCVPHPNPMASYKSALGKSGAARVQQRRNYQRCRIYSEHDGQPRQAPGVGTAEDSQAQPLEGDVLERAVEGST